MSYNELLGLGRKEESQAKNPTFVAAEEVNTTVTNGKVRCRAMSASRFGVELDFAEEGFIVPHTLRGKGGGRCAA